MATDSPSRARESEAETQTGISVFDLPQPTSKERLEFLSDGIFAVAMTILVLDLKVPSLPHGATSIDLLGPFLELWPKVGAFIISFLFLARNWYIHRLVFHSIGKVDYRFSYLNILLLMINCFLPFTTSLVSEYPHASIAAAAYIGNMILTPFVIFAMLHHAIAFGLVKRDINPEVLRWFRKRHMMIIGVYLVAFPVAYFSAEFSVFWIFCYQLFTALPPFFRQRPLG
jgi:uncharacterized membrane protein